MFSGSYWEALCDRDLDIEEEDSSSESGADSNWLLGIAEDTANAGKMQLHNKRKQIKTPGYIMLQY